MISFDCLYLNIYLSGLINVVLILYYFLAFDMNFFDYVDYFDELQNNFTVFLLNVYLILLYLPVMFYSIYVANSDDDFS